MALGLFDRPLKAQTMLKYPQLYKNSQSESDFNIKVFWTWIFNAVLHSILLYYVCFGALKHGEKLNLFFLNLFINYFFYFFSRCCIQ